ncbi:unnamed protein product [Paramecium octaurelia]|uniref:Uncharacterized protein n=1 Tax=Paramecium octaurelia TaxID=43137 RepID=A0A8S1Y3Y2_PAROT|nr:unnamed protein product [Paramecium octaurelia]
MTKNLFENRIFNQFERISVIFVLYYNFYVVSQNKKIIIIIQQSFKEQSHIQQIIYRFKFACVEILKDYQLKQSLIFLEIIPRDFKAQNGSYQTLYVFGILTDSCKLLGNLDIQQISLIINYLFIKLLMLKYLEKKVYFQTDLNLHQYQKIIVLISKIDIQHKILFEISILMLIVMSNRTATYLLSNWNGNIYNELWRLFQIQRIVTNQTGRGINIEKE